MSKPGAASLPVQAPAIRPGFVLGVSIIALLFIGFHIFFGRWVYFPALDRPPAHNLLISDFARLWYVGRRIWAALGVVPQPPPLLGADILAPTAPVLSAWLYPPTTGLLAMPFALLPMTLGFWVWSFGGLVLGYWLLRVAGLPVLAVLMGLLSPAGYIDLGDGQLGTLTGSFLVAALLMSGRRQYLAGFLVVGGLIIKPQTALMVPLAWLRGCYKKAFLTAAVTLLVALGFSWAVEGHAAWARYLDVGLPDALAIPKLPLSKYFPLLGITVPYTLQMLHMPLRWVGHVQMAISLCSMAMVWLAWRQGAMAPLPRLAFTLCLGILATPYDFSYDLVGYSIAMAALAVELPGFAGFFAALLWLMGGYTGVLVGCAGLFLFPFCALGGAVLAWKVRNAPALQ